MSNIVIYDYVNQLSFPGFDTIMNAEPTGAYYGPTRISGYVDSFYVSMNGSFTYSSYDVTGTLSGISIYHGGQPVLVYSGFNVDLDDLFYGIPSEDPFLKGDDTITSYWNTGEYYDSGTGNDRIRLGTGDDTVNGGAGVDTYVLETAFDPATISWSGSRFVIDGVFGRDTLSGIELVEFADATYALAFGSGTTTDGDAHALTRGVVNDLIVGNSYSETIHGFAGTDRLYGNRGDDKIFGGAGIDLLNGGAGNDRLFGGDDYDLLIGGTGRDFLNGGAAGDRLRGSAGHDTLLGALGNDTLLGEGGNDLLKGQKGNDVLTGGSGRDTFYFRKGDGRDTITDFAVGTDTIEIGRGAARFRALELSQDGDDVLVAFANVVIRVEDVTLAAMDDASNFLF